MNKTLHKGIIKKDAKFYSTQSLTGCNTNLVLADLVESMQGYLDIAAKETLSPRRQAILQLLKKATV